MTPKTAIVASAELTEPGAPLNASYYAERLDGETHEQYALRVKVTDLERRADEHMRKAARLRDQATEIREQASRLLDQADELRREGDQCPL